MSTYSENTNIAFRMCRRTVDLLAAILIFLVLIGSFLVYWCWIPQRTARQFAEHIEAADFESALGMYAQHPYVTPFLRDIPSVKPEATVEPATFSQVLFRRRFVKIRATRTRHIEPQPWETPNSNFMVAIWGDRAYSIARYVRFLRWSDYGR